MDPYTNSRTHPADGSIRYALTPEECQEAARRLDSIHDISSLLSYLNVYRGCIGSGEPYRTSARYWNDIIQNTDTIRRRVQESDRKRARLQEARRNLEDEIKKLTDEALELEEEGRSNIQYIRTHLVDIKDTIRTQQQSLRRTDEKNIKEAAREKGEKIIVLPPSNAFPDVRPLSLEEISARAIARCTKCLEYGHWWNDHLSITCPHCKIAGPGHKPDWCPAFPRLPALSVAPATGSQGSWSVDTNKTEVGWGSWNVEKIDERGWKENAWNPITNNTEAAWSTPATKNWERMTTKPNNARERRRQKRAENYRVQFLLTPGDRKKMKEKQVRFRVKAEEKEDGEMSSSDDGDWWKDLSLDGDDCFDDEAMDNIVNTDRD
jgi:hypothetical protein